ncbi:hypothetical protein BH012_20055 [Salmonella enterica]|nr:hypothetical protein [Salmonella enterica]EAX6603589.1 hypothetical protein [Salmonella enterica]
MKKNTDKELQDDVRNLHDDMYEMWRRLGQLDSKYRDNTNKISTYSLVAYVITLAREDLLEANRKLIKLNEIINNDGE